MEFHLRFYLPPLVYSLITSCRAMVISIIVDTGQTMAPPAFTTLRDHLEGRAFSSPFSLGDHLSLIPKSACSSRVLLSSIDFLTTCLIGSPGCSFNSIPSSNSPSITISSEMSFFHDHYYYRLKRKVHRQMDNHTHHGAGHAQCGLLWGYWSLGSTRNGSTSMYRQPQVLKNRLLIHLSEIIAILTWCPYRLFLPPPPSPSPSRSHPTSGSRWSAWPVGYPRHHAP